MKEKLADPSADSVLFWKRRYERQRLLLNSVLSLLNKYGTSLDLERLHREFLLTSMGQFLAASSAYYSRGEEGRNLVPTLSYGIARKTGLPRIRLTAKVIELLLEIRRPFRLDHLPGRLHRLRPWKTLADLFSLATPLLLEDRLIGLLLLGRKITGLPYSESELEFIQAFSAVSAVTFNNASLLSNVRASMREVQKLFDIRSDLVSRMTHEFRTPLTVIKAGLETLKIDAKYRKIYEGIEESVARLEDLIGSLLELNSAAYDFEETAPNPLKPAVLINRCLAASAQDAAAKNVSFSVRLCPGTPEITTRISEERFLLVICNLIDNAIKYTRPCTQVVIELEEEPRMPDEGKDGRALADWRKIYRKAMEEYSALAGLTAYSEVPQTGPEWRGEERDEHSFWVVKVKDSGIGIPPEDLDYISEPFRMASNSPEIGIRGKGLGLAVAMKLLAETGGLLYCKTKVGRGSTFTAFFPTEKVGYVPD